MSTTQARPVRELGDLTPIREVLGELEAWEGEDLERRGEDDQVVRALRKVRRRLDAAIADAAHPEPVLYIEDYAQLEGIGVWAAYKRYERGRIPGAVKDASGRIVIPIDYDAQESAA